MPVIPPIPATLLHHELAAAESHPGVDEVSFVSTSHAGAD